MKTALLTLSALLFLVAPCSFAEDATLQPDALACLPQGAAVAIAHKGECRPLAYRHTPEGRLHASVPDMHPGETCTVYTWDAARNAPGAQVGVLCAVRNLAAPQSLELEWYKPETELLPDTSGLDGVFFAVHGETTAIRISPASEAGEGVYSVNIDNIRALDRIGMGSACTTFDAPGGFPCYVAIKPAGEAGRFYAYFYNAAKLPIARLPFSAGTP